MNTAEWVFWSVVLAVVIVLIVAGVMASRSDDGEA